MHHHPGLLAASLTLASSLLAPACRSTGEPAPSTPIPAAVAPPAAAFSAVPATPGEKAAFGPHQPPVQVRVHGPAQVQAGQNLEIIVQIDKRVGSLAKVALELSLPPGTELVSGQLQEELAAENGTTERRFVVHVTRVPSEDFKLVAKTGTAAFGAQATGFYRFGRPAPALAEPQRAPKDTVIGPRNLGKPIRLER